MARLPNFLVIIRSEKLSGKGQGRGVGVRKKERFVLGKRTFRSQKSKHFVLRIIQGWIDTLHGGIQAVLLDEICAWVVLRKLQTTGVTSKMETRYMKPVNTNDSHIVLKASIKERKRNIVFVEAAIYNNKEELCTKALCTYFTFSQEKAKEEMHFLNCEVEQDEIIPLI